MKGMNYGYGNKKKAPKTMTKKKSGKKVKK